MKQIMRNHITEKCNLQVCNLGLIIKEIKRGCKQEKIRMEVTTSNRKYTLSAQSLRLKYVTGDMKLLKQFYCLFLT